MEIVDELMTPGCPNCFVKHMSIAGTYGAEGGAACPVCCGCHRLAEALSAAWDARLEKHTK